MNYIYMVSVADDVTVQFFVVCRFHGVIQLRAKVEINCFRVHVETKCTNLNRVKRG